MQRGRSAGAALVVLVGLVAHAGPGRAQEAVATGAPEAAHPVAAGSGAMAECRANEGGEDDLATCLEAMERRVAGALEGVMATAVAHFAELDAITGNQRATRTLAQAQAAFELYRDLDCHLVELGQGVSAAAGDHRRACRVDHDRARLAKLAALLPASPAEAPGMTDADGTGALAGTTWRAVEIEGDPVAEGVEITFEIDATGGFAGHGGCNRYFGTARVAAGQIDLGRPGATRMACAEPAMGEEHRYLQALDTVTGWRISGDTLSLEDDDGAVRVRFDRPGG